MTASTRRSGQARGEGARLQVKLLGPAVLLAIALVAFVLGHDRVDLAHATVLGASDGPGIVNCYTSGIVGDLVADPAAGVAVVEKTGARYMVMWPSASWSRPSETTGSSGGGGEASATPS